MTCPRSHNDVKRLELDSRCLNGQTNNFPTVWSCSADISWWIRREPQGTGATSPPEICWQKFFCSLCKYISTERVLLRLASAFSEDLGWEEVERKGNRREMKSKGEQNKARGKKINASLQAGGSCGCDEYLPGSGLMILEMFFRLYWVLVGLFFKK